jgi:hypothetical protein
MRSPAKLALPAIHIEGVGERIVLAAGQRLTVAGRMAHACDPTSTSRGPFEDNAGCRDNAGIRSATSVGRTGIIAGRERCQGARRCPGSGGPATINGGADVSNDRIGSASDRRRTATGRSVSAHGRRDSVSGGDAKVAAQAVPSIVPRDA